ncbi:DNA polymerase II [Thalassotalea crassostreae]|uniref:DNA polymerase II n=1 Tax=Thalassotalea crassostreae TaxID=1763536 RepID=UPI0008393C58|nr:DNA polymerase II [Thalassotalea crassostreae]
MSQTVANQLQQGFILTRQVRDTAKGIQLCYWLKSPEGPVKLLIDNELAVFFVEEYFVEKAKALLIDNQLFLQSKSLTLTSFMGKPVSGFYFNSLTKFYQARDLLKSNSIKCYEDDIRPDDRFIMERFITGSMEFLGHSNQKQGYRQVYTNKVRKVNYTPKLTMLSIDIECSFDGELYSIGAYSDDVSKVFMIGEPEAHCKDYIQWVEDEYDLLLNFISWLNKNDPDIIIGWNVINFDFKLLQKRCDLNNIKFAIGRDGSAPYWRKNNRSEQNFIHIAGRVVLDGIDLLRSATYSFPSFSLEYVAQAILGIGKDIEDVDNRVAEITRKFLYEKQALAGYNLEDCRLVWLVFEKTLLLDFAILRSQLTGLELDRIGGSVAAFTNLYLPKLHRAGYVAPNMGDGESDLVSPGGYVMDSIPGLYKNVLVLDFKSLYPSIIRSFNIDPMGLIEGLLQANEQGLELNENVVTYSATSDQPIPGFDGAWFSRSKHFLPDIIEQLWQERDKAKKQKNSALSQAIKIIMNSFYGVLGSTGCRFFDPRLSGSITKRSHQLLNQTKDWIEGLGYRVIYGDTDSIFVSIGEDKSDRESQEIGVELMNFINNKMDKELNENYAIDSALEIEFETHFHQFLMPTVRGQDIGTKKRYAGIVGRDKQEKLIFKGLESVRTDWTILAKEFQQTLYLKVFKGEPVDDYILDIVKKTLNGEMDDKLVYRKRIRRKLSDYEKNVPPHVKAARDADAINAQLNKPLRYQNRGWIEYILTVNGPQTVEHVRDHIDYPIYIERQLGAVADGILPFIGKSFSDITDEQMQLF